MIVCATLLLVLTPAAAEPMCEVDGVWQHCETKEESKQAPPVAAEARVLPLIALRAEKSELLQKLRDDRKSLDRDADRSVLLQQKLARLQAIVGKLEDRAVAPMLACAKRLYPAWTKRMLKVAKGERMTAGGSVRAKPTPLATPPGCDKALFVDEQAVREVSLLYDLDAQLDGDFGFGQMEARRAVVAKRDALRKKYGKFSKR